MTIKLDLFRASAVTFFLDTNNTYFKWPNSLKIICNLATSLGSNKKEVYVKITTQQQ